MKKLIFCFIATLILTNILSAQKSNTRAEKILKPEINTAAIDSFETLIKSDISNKKISGGTYLLYEKGNIVASNIIGESDVSTHSPLKRNSFFRIQSMTKPIASLALLLLQEDGLINMNDRLDKYLPDFANPVVFDRRDTLNGVVFLRTHPAKNPIFLRNLLTHTAGFPSGFSPIQKDIYEATYKDVTKYDLAHFCKELSKLPLDYEPGESWEYGQSTNVAARVIEIVSGMSFKDFLNKRIFGPMQMNDTKFHLDSTDASRHTTLYKLDEKGEMAMADPGNVSSVLISGPKVFTSASGGLISTMDDYLKFCIMILKNGMHGNKIIAKPETIALMKTDQLPSNINGSITGNPDKGFTFGYQIIRREGNSTPLPEKSISWSGSNCTSFFIDPKREVIGIYLSQNENYGQIPSWQNFYNWMTKAFK